MQLTQSIIKTLCYSEVFSYPLRMSELWKYLIHTKKISKQELQNEVLKNKHIFEVMNGYVFLRGSSKLIKVRNHRFINSRKKYVKAIRIAALLSLIPTLKLIGLSGSLSMNNAKKDDDIDFFFVTRRNTVWISRFLVVCVLLLLSEKRSKGKSIARDRICPNMFLSESRLSLRGSLRNIYTAHEISQVKILFERGETHMKFLAENSWVLRFLPHAFITKNNVVIKENKKLDLLVPLEYFMFLVQFLYMKKSITHEKIEKDVAMFHPHKNDQSVQAIYTIKVRYWQAILRRKKNKIIRYELASFN